MHRRRQHCLPSVNALRQSPPLADAYYNQSLLMFGQAGTTALSVRQGWATSTELDEYMKARRTEPPNQRT
jgi:hypothetical protein